MLFRSLGIDPGLQSTGFGVIEKHGLRLRYISSGRVRSGSGSLPERIKVLLEGIQAVIAEYTPNQSAIEQVFVNVNPKSTLLLGQARGAALSALVQAGLPVAEGVFGADMQVALVNDGPVTILLDSQRLF